MKTLLGSRAGLVRALQGTSGAGGSKGTSARRGPNSAARAIAWDSLRSGREWAVLILAAALAACCVFAISTTAGADDKAGEQAGEKAADETKLESILVVFESSGKLVAMRVVKEHQIAVLQACFPDFHARPKSDTAVKWAPRYEIYFNFQDGRTTRVLVSSNSRYWTVGRGELEMRGMYFSGVIHELLKANATADDE